MTPYYEDGFATIYHGDCRDLLPVVTAQTKVAMLLTDPPYGLDRSDDYRSLYAKINEARGHRWRGRSYAPMEGDSEPFDPSHLLGVAHRTVLWGADHYSDKLPRCRGWLVWDKRDDIPPNVMSDAELAWTDFGTPTRVFRHRWQGYTRASEVGQHLHPTQKPVALMGWILDRWTDPGELVVDPYMGSGPVLKAAKERNRRAIGIEIEERYCEVAAKRLAQEVLDFGGVA